MNRHSLRHSIALLSVVFLSIYGASCSSVETKSNFDTLALDSIEVTPATGTLAIGTAKLFTATGKYSDGSVVDLTSRSNWSSSNLEVGAFSGPGITVEHPGLLHALKVGTVRVSASYGGKSGNAEATITGAHLVAIGVTAPDPIFAQLTQQQLVATGIFSDSTKQDFTQFATWSSSNELIATVGSAEASPGLAHGLNPGTATITALFNGVSGQTVLTVTGTPLVRIEVNPPNSAIPKGLTQTLTATGVFEDASTQDLTEFVTWNSSDATVATVNQGLVTSVNTGVTTITASLTGIDGHSIFTVTNAALVSMSVTPTNLTLPKGLSQQYTATGSYTDGSTQDITSAVTWTSSNSSAAQVSNLSGSQGIATSINTGVTIIKAVSGTVSDQTQLTVTSAALVSINLTPTNPSIPKGLTQQFTATGTYTDSTTQNLTSTVIWTSSNESVAQVSNASGSEGLATSVNIGLTTLTATSGTISGETQLTVTNAALASISITPTNPTIPKGLTQQFTATGTYTDGSTQNLTNMATWSSSQSTVAQVSNAGGSRGLATSINTGGTTISAVLGLITGQTQLTVTNAALLSIGITPTNPTIPKGVNQQFTATGTYTDNTTKNITAEVNWTSSNVSVAQISNASGSHGLASSVNTGTTTITAAISGTSGQTLLTVTNAALTSIGVTPTNPSIPKGLSQQFIATGSYTDGSTQEITSGVTWTSSNLSVAQISNAAGSQGLATSINVGVSMMTATSGLISGQTQLTVISTTLVSINITPTNPNIPKGRTAQFTATGTYTDNSTQDLTATVTWSSSAPSVAEISNAVGSQGLATSVDTGVTTVTAALGLISAQTQLTVTSAELLSINITPTNPSLPKGLTQQFTATGTYTDATTQNLTSIVTWSSSVPSVAEISNAVGSRGLATSVDTGVASITATLGLISAQTQLTVTSAELDSISLTPTNPSIPKGLAQQFTATGRYTDNSTQDITPNVTWTSSNLAAAEISNAAGSVGLATSIDSGVTTIRASLGLFLGETQLTVTNAELISIGVTPNNPTLPIGLTESFTATGVYTDGSRQNLTTTATWSSTNEGVATISNAAGSQGVATALFSGSTTILATVGAISGSTPMTVADVLLVSIGVTPNNPSTPKGLTVPFIATGVYSNGSTQDLTTSSTWSSLNESVAAISNASGSQGNALALLPGSTTITATVGTISGSTPMAVTDAALVSINVSPGNPTIPKGLTLPFIATGVYTDGSSQDLTSTATWNSLNGSVATISNAAGSQGVATALLPGSSAVVATVSTISGSTTMTVTNAILVSMGVTPISPSVPQGLTKRFMATGTYSDGSSQDLTTTATWSSQTESVATISNAAGSQGVATALLQGSTTIVATIGSISAFTTMTVIDPILVLINVTPTTPSVAAGTTIQFTATGTLSDSSTDVLTTSVIWSSTNNRVATVSNAPGSAGLATTFEPGSTRIIATLGTISGETRLNASPHI